MKFLEKHAVRVTCCSSTHRLPAAHVAGGGRGFLPDIDQHKPTSHRPQCDSEDSISARDRCVGGMLYRHYIKDVGPNGFAVVGASLAGRGDRGYHFEGRDGRLGQLQRRMTSMSQLRHRMIADMTAAGFSASTKEVARPSADAYRTYPPMPRRAQSLAA